jgi:hypothetical protein
MKTNIVMPERRNGFRILTIKNVRNAAIVIAVVFVVISVASELRDTTSGRYGRLYGKQVSKVASPLAPAESVPEEMPTVAEQTYADPMLLDSAKREAYLGVSQATAATTATTVPAAAVRSGDIAISGSATTGVEVTTTRREKPVLSGGFGR